MFEGSFAVELGYDDPKGYEGEGKGRKVITDADVRRGLATMARKCAKDFAAVMADEGDADTADVFIQLVLFGEVIYG